MAFPNPFEHTISVYNNINAAKSALWNVKLINVAGSVVYTKENFKFTSNKPLLISSTDFPAGAYILQLTNGKSLVNKRMIKI